MHCESVVLRSCLKRAAVVKIDSRGEAAIYIFTASFGMIGIGNG